MELKTKKEFLINLLFFLATAGIIFVVCRFLLQYLLPFVVASIIAWLVQKPSRYLARTTRIKRKTWAPILAGLLYISVFAVAVLLVYWIIASLSNILGDVPDYVDKFTKFFDNLRSSFNAKFKGFPPDIVNYIDEIYQSTLTSVYEGATNLFSDFAASFAKKIPSFLISSVVAAVASCYIAKDFLSLARFLQSMCGKKIYKNIVKVKIIFVESVLNFAKGYTLLMLITYVELCVGLLILRVKYAPLIALAISFIDILPVLGTGSVLVPWAIAEAVFGNESLSIGIVVIYVLITIIRNFIEPKIIGKQLGINPLFTLLTMFVGIKLFGLAGMVILPVTFIVVFKYYKNEMEQENSNF